MRDSIHGLSRPLAHFLPRLLRVPAIRDRINRSFRGQLAFAIKEIRAGRKEPLIEICLSDEIEDLIGNNSEPVRDIAARGGMDEFSIQIIRYGPVYWISAPEFDDIGYFGSLRKAVACAQVEYDVYIERVHEGEDDEEDE